MENTERLEHVAKVRAHIKELETKYRKQLEHLKRLADALDDGYVPRITEEDFDDVNNE